MSAKTKTSIRIGEADRHILPPCLGPTLAWQESLARYHEIITTEEARVRKMFAPDEWEVIMSSCKGVTFRAGAIRGAVLSAVYDAAVGSKKVQAALELKLAALTPVQSYALVHIIETEA